MCYFTYYYEKSKKSSVQVLNLKAPSRRWIYKYFFLKEHSTQKSVWLPNSRMTPMSMGSPEYLVQTLPFPKLMTSWMRTAPSLLPSWVHPFRCQEKCLTSLSLEQPRDRQSWVEVTSLRLILPEFIATELEKPNTLDLQHIPISAPPRLVVPEAAPTAFPAPAISGGS